MVVVPVWPAAGVTVTVRFDPLPPKLKLFAGTNTGFAAQALNVRLPGAVFASPIVNAFGAVGTPSVVAWSARMLMVGGVLLPPTVSRKVSLPSCVPSLTVTVMIDVPLKPAVGVTVTVRFEPKPLKTMLFTGTKVGFDDPARNCRLAASTCASLTVNGMGMVGTLRIVLWSAMSLIVGGVSVMPQLANRSASRTVASPLGSVTVNITR